MWYSIQNDAAIATPALAVYPDRIRENIRRMISIAGGPERLCPHVKTHKLSQVVDLYMEAGVRKFKCATIAELEMVASCKADFALLAYQPVGPHAERLLQVADRFPTTTTAAVVDNATTITRIADVASAAQIEIPLLLDLDVGMGRTGIVPGDLAIELYEQIASLDGVSPGGLHVYDGHIHDEDIADRASKTEAAMSLALGFRDQLLAANLPVPMIIAGGTPTFPIHAKATDRLCSPGTPVFWDAGYEEHFPDLEFLHAAVLLTRVVSKLPNNRVCVDLGYKAIASEQPHPRARFLSEANVVEVGHSEEHLVIETSSNLESGDLLYVIPKHICPTVALHQEALVIEDGQVCDSWSINARDRRISI